MQDEIPERIGDYEILGTLGAGGMGRVYRVRNVISDRIEAMKILLPDLAGRKELADRFLREIKLVGSLNHPNIASLCTAMAVDNQLIMVMEFVEGKTLAELLDAGALPIADSLSYLNEVLAALGYAHSKGIIHRDIKPANIMLTVYGGVKLMDFGIARVGTERATTQTGTTLGSIDYMSPEQIMGNPVDARSDLYSVGISLYEMVTGQRPFRAPSDFEIMSAHVKEVARPPIEIQANLPTELNEVIVRSIAKAPEDRFQSAEEMRAALADVDLSSITSIVPARTRSATIVERQRPATMVERRGTISRTDAYTGRSATQVAGALAFSQPNSSALAVRKSGLLQRPALLLVCGGVLAAGVAVPTVLLRRGHSDSGKSTPSAVVPAPPAGDSPSQAPVQPRSAAAAGKMASPHAPKSAPAALAAQRAALAAHAGTGAAPAQSSTPNLAINTHASITTAPAAPAISAEEKEKLDQLEVQIDGLTSRAQGVNNSLNNMQRSMQRDGMALRGDMVSKQASMNNNVAKARQALIASDAARASRFAALAETDIGQLETFLGH